jgi:hypothetical protein
MRKTALVLVSALIVACDAPARAPVVERAKGPDEARGEELLRANASLPSDPALVSAYTDINARYFDSRLPPVRIRWEERLETIGPLIAEGFRLEGLTDGRVMLLHPSLEADERQFRAVLCHEMVHVDLRDRADGHGPEFQSRLRSLADRGAFEGMVATEAEKQELQRSIEQHAARLTAELNDLRQLPARLEAEAPGLAREAVQDRVWEYNKRVRRHNDAVDEFNRLVAQYNLMITYPDGLDRQRLAGKAGATEISR